MLERLRRVSFLGFFSVAALAGCDRPERELAPPAVLKSTTPSPASDTTLYYDYQHKPVMLAIDPSHIVVEATTDPRSIAASVLQSLGVGIASSTPLIQAHGHWLLQLSGGLNAASAQAAAAALHAVSHASDRYNVRTILNGPKHTAHKGEPSVCSSSRASPSRRWTA